ncbi:MAG: ATP-dependent Clp protease ATP-binding subunit [Patescibacteria group bacterium]
MIELFFHYKVSRVLPAIPVEKNDGKKIYDSFTLQAVDGFATGQTTTQILQKLIKYPQIKAIMQKTTITHTDLPLEPLKSETLAQSAFDTAKTFRGNYVTTIDIFLAYLLMIEKDTKLLFAKQLKTQDLVSIVTWARVAFPQEENPKKIQIHIEGGGFGDALVDGWTPETQKYTADFTSLATRGEPFIKGREAEFKTMLESILRLESNNVLLVGESGVGKEHLIRALAYHSFEGNLGGGLNYKKFYQLLVGALTAGASTRSDLEVRLQAIIGELSHASDVVLYIPEFQNIVGATSYNLDLSGAILPYLQSGNMPIIATMTTGSYKAYMDRNPLKEAFTIIPMKEPDKEATMQMVLAEASVIEKKYKVILSYRAIVASVELADRFLQDQVLPGSAIALLGTVANTVSLSDNADTFEKTHHKIVLEKDVITKVEQTVHVAIAAPSQSEINTLLHLEEKIHERLIDQEYAVTAIAEAMRRIRSGVMTSERPISFLFLGPTGVGKTETAKALASYYFGGEKNMIRFDMSEYTDEAGLLRLLGSPPGKGSERGLLTEQIRDNPASLILLDEFEKAHPAIHNLFLQILDDGRLTDNKGETVSFRNAIIIATSNAGSEFIREELSHGTTFNKAFHQKLVQYLQTKGIFKPELLNRFDDVVTFKPLGPEQITKVVHLMLNELIKHLAEQDVAVTFDEAVIEKIVSEGFDKDFGARPLRRYIQDNIEDLLAQHTLTKDITRGKKVNFFLNGTGALDISVE